MSDLRDAACKAMDALKCLVEAYEMQNMIRADINDAEYAITALKAALEKPKFILSCGCSSQHAGVPAYWTEDGGIAFGMLCEKHWHEYDARSEA